MLPIHHQRPLPLWASSTIWHFFLDGTSQNWSIKTSTWGHTNEALHWEKNLSGQFPTSGKINIVTSPLLQFNFCKIYQARLQLEYEIQFLRQEISNLKVCKTNWFYINIHAFSVNFNNDLKLVIMKYYKSFVQFLTSLCTVQNYPSIIAMLNLRWRVQCQLLSWSWVLVP